LSVLYVALTRAKSYLDVVVSASKKLKPTLEEILREGWRHSEAGEHLIEQCEPNAAPNARADHFVMGEDATIWRRGDTLAIPHFQPVPNRLAAVTPSGQEGAGRVKLGFLLNTGNAPALEKGTAVHALLSRVEWSDGLPALEDWVRSIPAREANLEACRLAARALHPRLRQTRDPLAQVFDQKRWLDRWKNEGVVRLEVWRERRFAVVLGHELMNGSFDRVVIGSDIAGNRLRAEILDFKTDHIANDDEREQRRAHYQPQLDAYAGALQKLIGLSSDAVQTQLVWID
jgi:ATP-dependent exoDNAse (exonuclease V) beta subunit